MIQRYVILFLVVFLLGAGLVFGQRIGRNRIPGHLKVNKIKVGDQERTFYLFVPRRIVSKQSRRPRFFLYFMEAAEIL